MLINPPITRYDIWLDLDKTIFNSYLTFFNSSKRIECWAMNLYDPFSLSNPFTVEARNGLCILQEGFVEWFNKAKNFHYSVNFISAGAEPGLPHELQPSVKILKLFGLYDRFDKKIILPYPVNKGSLIGSGRNLDVFIDDSEEFLDQARKENIHMVVDRNSFSTWDHCSI